MRKMTPWEKQAAILFYYNILMYTLTISEELKFLTIDFVMLHKALTKYNHYNRKIDFK